MCDDRKTDHKRFTAVQIGPLLGLGILVVGVVDDPIVVRNREVGEERRFDEERQETEQHEGADDCTGGEKNQSRHVAFREVLR